MGTTNARHAWPRRGAGGVALALLFLAAPLSAAPSAPGSALLGAAELARATVVGRVTQVTQLDRSGYAATIEVERVLGGSAERGTTLRIGWEELSSRRPPRLGDGQRVAVALEDLPAGSLWRERFPLGGGAFVIAARGDAVLVDPSAGDLDLLAGYLATAGGPGTLPGATALATIAAQGSPVLAEAAVARLASLPSLGRLLDASAVDLLMRTAADAQKPLALRREIVALAGAARLSAAAPALEALAQPTAPLEPEALMALGLIRDGLPAAQVEALLERQEPALRAVGARFATGTLAERRLPPLVRSDPSPQVRAAAAAALAGTRTIWGVDGALPALGDADPLVRSTAAEALGALGPPAVPTLETTARNKPELARGAITALALAGPDGVAALRKLAADHSDEHVRDFARLALGRGPRAH